MIARSDHEENLNFFIIMCLESIEINSQLKYASGMGHVGQGSFIIFPPPKVFLSLTICILTFYVFSVKQDPYDLTTRSLVASPDIKLCNTISRKTLKHQNEFKFTLRSHDKGLCEITSPPFILYDLTIIP